MPGLSARPVISSPVHGWLGQLPRDEKTGALPQAPADHVVGARAKLRPGRATLRMGLSFPAPFARPLLSLLRRQFDWDEWSCVPLPQPFVLSFFRGFVIAFGGFENFKSVWLGH